MRGSRLATSKAVCTPSDPLTVDRGRELVEVGLGQPAEGGGHPGVAFDIALFEFDKEFDPLLPPFLGQKLAAGFVEFRTDIKNCMEQFRCRMFVLPAGRRGGR